MPSAPWPRLTSALDASGPAVARLFHRLLALTFLVAYASLGTQIHILIGERGLLPLEPLARALEARDAPLLSFPTLFRFFPTDGALTFGVLAGLAVSSLALAGVRPRLTIALATALYVSFTVACRTFMSFQWDNLLIECGVVATLLPRHERAFAVHFLLRLVLFKLYFESGIAKYQSHLGDWQDGSAMTKYYETAPIPAVLAWWAHHLPAWWHHFESRATLAWELVLPFAFFLPRRPRLAAGALATGFQVVNIATANYGFFSYLACAMHVMLLEDADVDRMGAFAKRRWRRAAPWLERAGFHPRQLEARVRLAARSARRARETRPARHALARVDRGVAVGFAMLATVHSVFDGAEGFARMSAPFEHARAVVRSMRLVNTYHLFGHITRERPEAEVQLSRSPGGEDFQAWHFHYKPGPLDRRPPLVAPHQPRVDFQLWFFGLGRGRGLPDWVRGLVDRVCHDPRAVDDLFTSRLPSNTARVRIALFAYEFTTPKERAATGNFWKRTPLGHGGEIRCAR